MVLSIAAASQMQLGETAELTTEIMHGYSIGMNEVNHVSDMLVKTASLSTTEVRDIGESLKYVGNVASMVGVKFGQTGGMLAALSNMGIKGSQAGTSLRMGFLRLAKIASSDASGKSKMGKKKKMLLSYGLQLTDEKDNFRDMPTILEEMEKKTAKMGNAQKLGFYGDIFGAESATTFIDLGKAAKSGYLKEMFDFFRLSTMRANAALVGHAVASTALAIQQKGTAIATASQWLWRDARLEIPKIGALMEVSLGYKETGLSLWVVM